MWSSVPLLMRRIIVSFFVFSIIFLRATQRTDSERAFVFLTSHFLPRNRALLKGRGTIYILRHRRLASAGKLQRNEMVLL